MALELKIISPSEEGFVKQIVWNADEIAEYVAGRSKGQGDQKSLPAAV